MLNPGVTQMSKRFLPLRASKSSGDFRPELMTTRVREGVGAGIPSGRIATEAS